MDNIYIVSRQIEDEWIVTAFCKTEKEAYAQCYTEFHCISPVNVGEDLVDVFRDNSFYPADKPYEITSISEDVIEVGLANLIGDVLSETGDLPTAESLGWTKELPLDMAVALQEGLDSGLLELDTDDKDTTAVTERLE